MIVEVLLSTLDPAGQPNFAPMGVMWGEDELIVKPFRATRTYANLVATGYAVANVTDDALAFVDTALAHLALPHFPAETVPGVVFAGVCYWRELAVIGTEGGPERAKLRCRVTGRGWRRDFVGFNRARGAVLEAAILATRLHLLAPSDVHRALVQYQAIVLKTGDEPERVALARVQEHVRCWYAATDH
jgi:uncharacterized protein